MKNVQPHAIRSICYVTIALFGGLTLSACSAWDEQVAAPEDFKSSYTKLHDCKASAHPRAEYVVTWLSPEGEATWDAYASGDLDVDFPVGTVSVKAQYTDDKCANLDTYTIMEKVSEDSSTETAGWLWQYVNDEGGCINCDNGVSCASCHAGCQAGPTYFCTAPEEM